MVPREDGPAASLASYQLEVLRDKNRELTRRLNELYANAQDNERLTIRTHQLALALMRADTAADTVRAMVACLSEDFQGDAVRVVLFQAVPDLTPDWLQIIVRRATSGWCRSAIAWPAANRSAAGSIRTRCRCCSATSSARRSRSR